MKGIDVVMVPSWVLGLLRIAAFLGFWWSVGPIILDWMTKGMDE